jgi:hypothetical protein
MKFMTREKTGRKFMRRSANLQGNCLDDCLAEAGKSWPVTTCFVFGRPSNPDSGRIPADNDDHRNQIRLRKRRKRKFHAQREREEDQATAKRDFI